MGGGPGHSCPRGNTMKQSKGKKQPVVKPLKGRRVWEIGTALLLLAVLVVTAAALRGGEGEREARAARKRLFAVARVTDVLADHSAEDTWTEGRRLGEQYIEVKLLTGPFKGTVLETSNYLNAYTNVDCRLGTRIVVRLDYDDHGEPYIISVPNYDRGLVLAGLLVVFGALLVLIGGKKGAMALLGLAYTLACLWYLLVPLILRGADPILVSIGVVALTTAASLLLLTGFSRKMLCATLGCVGGVAAAGIFAGLAGTISPLNGFNLSEAEELVLRAGDSKLHISGLLVSGILIASLGAVMDVAMSIASSCNELRELNPNLTRAELFRSGMNIGRDAMGTMANTLILAFAGASLNMLILFRVYDYPLIQIANTDAMAVEVIRGVAGSIGIVLTVPLVALLSSRFMGPKPKT